MSDEEIQELRRRVSGGGLREALAFLTHLLRAGMITFKEFTGCPYVTEKHDVSKRCCLPGAEVSLDEAGASEVFGHDAYERWSHDNHYALVSFPDGRWAWFSGLSFGTCSHCESSSDDWAFGDSLLEVVECGMSDEERSWLLEWVRGL